MGCRAALGLQGRTGRRVSGDVQQRAYAAHRAPPVVAQPGGVGFRENSARCHRVRHAPVRARPQGEAPTKYPQVRRAAPAVEAEILRSAAARGSRFGRCGTPDAASMRGRLRRVKTSPCERFKIFQRQRAAEDIALIGMAA